MEEFFNKIADPGIRVFSAKILKTGNGYHLEIQLEGLNDPTGAVSLKDLERYHRSLSVFIESRINDEIGERGLLPEDLTDENYSIEVSSAGAERGLRLPSDLERFCGRPLRIRFIKDAQSYTELATFIETRLNDAVNERFYVFQKYIPVSKRRKKHRENKKKDSSTNIWELSIDQLQNVNLYLDY